MVSLKQANAKRRSKCKKSFYNKEFIDTRPACVECDTFLMFHPNMARGGILQRICNCPGKVWLVNSEGWYSAQED